MKKILYIEDNQANRILIERVLAKYDYQLTFAEDGETGLSMAIEQKPDLILMDIGLPDFDGQTIGAMLRQMPELSSTRIVAMTAWPPDTVEQMVKRYNFDGCITKPINVANFPQQVAQFLE
ncbi:MAG: response regulator [Anaerolineales bacterium]|nr:response regulator [Anaerolineales bacterium]